MSDVIIVGGGIGGLSLALTLERAGISSTIYEATPAIQQVGVGINVLPYAMRVLANLGLEKELAQRAITTQASAYFDRRGSLLHHARVGRFAGETWPQLSIRRGELQAVLLDAVRQRLGPHRVRTGWECTGVSERDDEVCLSFRDRRTGQKLESQSAKIVVACDGIHSKIRQQFYPDEGPPRYSGVFMWRGVSCGSRFLDGATMVRVGLPSVGKMVIYPIHDYEDGTQLINWVAEIDVPDPGSFCSKRDWNCPGDAKDFVDVFANWRFDWLDVPELIRKGGYDSAIPHDGPGSTAALELWPRDAAGRRCSPIGASRLQWRRTGVARCRSAGERACRVPGSGRCPRALRGHQTPRDGRDCHVGSCGRPRHHSQGRRGACSIAGSSADGTRVPAACAGGMTALGGVSEHRALEWWGVTTASVKAAVFGGPTTIRCRLNTVRATPAQFFGGVYDNGLLQHH